MAIGGKPEEDIVKSLGIELDSKKKIIINELGQTSNNKIFAGGDITNTPSTVAYAARSGKDAAVNITKYLKGEL